MGIVVFKSKDIEIKLVNGRILIISGNRIGIDKIFENSVIIVNGVVLRIKDGGIKHFKEPFGDIDNGPVEANTTYSKTDGHFSITSFNEEKNKQILASINADASKKHITISSPSGEEFIFFQFKD